MTKDELDFLESLLVDNKLLYERVVSLEKELSEVKRNRPFFLNGKWFWPKDQEINHEV